MTEFFSSNQSLFAILIIIAVITSITALVLAIVNMLRINKLRDEITTLFAGKKGADLEEIVLENNKKIIEIDNEIQEFFTISNTVHKQSHKGLHKVGFIKFNPFGERAGNQSFALALLNTKNDGIILSSLHSREGTRIYAKQISNSEPLNNELTEEEREAIEAAK